MPSNNTNGKGNKGHSIKFSGQGDMSGTVREDGAVEATGQLTAVDSDPLATFTWSVVNGGDGTYGTLTIDATGKWTYVLDNSDASVQALAANEKASDTFTVVVTDNHGVSATKTVTMKISGSEDAPVITSDVAAASGAISELAGTTGSVATDSANGTITFGDVDLRDTHAVSQAAPIFSLSNRALTAAEIDALTAASHLELILADSTGTGNGSVSWTYSVTDGALDFLAQGEMLTVSYGVSVADNRGATALQNVTVSIAGSNEGAANSAPVAHDIAGTANEDDPPDELSYTANFTDADPDDTHTVTFDTTGTLGSVNVIDPGGGTFVYEATGPSGVLNQLAEGATIVDNFTYTVTDNHGAQSTATVSITVTGVNDEPVAYGEALGEAATDEDTPLQISSATLLANDTDVDAGDVLHIGSVSATSALGAAVSIDSNGTITYDATAASALQALGLGDAATDSFDYTVFDDHGSSSTATVTFSVGGVNDAPAIDNVLANAAYSAGAAGTVLGSGLSVSDVDSANLTLATVAISAGFAAGDVLAVDTAGTGIAASYNAATGVLTLTGSDTKANYQQVLNSVAFSSTSSDPTNSGSNPTRTIDWQASDGPAAGGPLFGAPIALPPGGYSGLIAVADVNADGMLDLAFASPVDNVAVLLGNGDGTFANPTTFDVGTNPTAVAIADVDGDSNPDLVVTNAYSNNVSVLLGSGDGTFGAATNFAVGALPRAVAVADLNGDGKADIATANHQDGNVSVLLGNGDGTFGAPTNYASGNITRAIAIADLNGDGSPDLAAVNEANTVSVFLGNGDGTFGAATSLAVGNHPTSVAIGDLDGDGDLDLAATNYYDSNVSVLLGNGNGTFAAANNFAAVSTASFVAMADLDDDGALDLAVTGLYSSSVAVLFGNGDGTFDTATSFATGAFPETLAIADFNGDGGLDLAMNGSVLLHASPGGAMSAVEHTTITIDDPLSMNL
ncbi:MAG: hypothetical protein EXR12_04405 [Rhodospirillaceae bacterium]|nr:hypothetical protein [Rhodospirillaceae bacterium]